jgi:hypothetical protein
MPADHGRFSLFTEILVGAPIGMWRWLTSRPRAKRPCQPFPVPNGTGERYGMVSPRALSYPLSGPHALPTAAARGERCL